ncbi:Polysaccharide deacetylase [hydrothermal vent metagenome]|uniref:Polysaccharide deacetylase n=1 Tax=hydrothermal vent metagenome TaxID=652676 RepID=A0A3B0RDL4_9ZZZZ
MNAPYMPDMSLKGKIRRRITRFSTRNPLPRFTGQYISFSFDDFPKSSATNGAAALQAQGLRGTYYACTGQMGMHNHFGEICASDDIKRLAASGHEIGCHTQNHIDCAISPSSVVQLDTARNLHSLRDLGINNARSFAFPYGDVSFASKKALAGQYETLRGVQPGINRSLADANQLLAVPLEGDLDNVGYADGYLQELLKNPGWLIFYTHDVRADCSAWGCTPELLQNIIASAKSLGIPIAPVGDIYQQILAETA